MKKILVLVDSIGRKKESFAQLISERIEKKGIKLTLARFSELIFEIDEKNISVVINGVDIHDYNLVYYRRVGDRFFSLGGSLAICLKDFNIPFFDTAFADVGPDEDKFTNLTRLAVAHLPIIPTFFCWHEKINENKQHIIDKFGFPMVVKTLDSHRGIGVSLIKTETDFDLIQKEGENKQFLFQKYLENDEEYRLLVLKDKVAVAERKRRTDPNEFRSNVALGAEEEFINVSKIPETMKEIAVRASQTLNIQTAGVDLLVDTKEKKTWLLEVNRGPGLTYDTKISPEIDELAKFFINEVDLQK